MARGAPLIPPHNHACARCGDLWQCDAPNKRKATKCMVTVAVSVNKTGPFCELCRLVVMVKRIAHAHGLDRAAVLARLGDVADLE